MRSEMESGLRVEFSVDKSFISQVIGLRGHGRWRSRWRRRSLERRLLPRGWRHRRLLRQAATRRCPGQRLVHVRSYLSSLMHPGSLLLLPRVLGICMVVGGIRVFLQRIPWSFSKASTTDRACARRRQRLRRARFVRPLHRRSGHHATAATPYHRGPLVTHNCIGVVVAHRLASHEPSRHGHLVLACFALLLLQELLLL